MTNTQVSIVLNGERLTLADLELVARDPHVKVRCDEAAMQRVTRGWAQLERVMALPPAEHPRVYGVSTGFGAFRTVEIPDDGLKVLQRNILLSHSAGVGNNADERDFGNYFPAEVVRVALVLRLNTFLKGHSGVRPATLEYIEGMINEGVVPLVPTRGSVGSSGDLCPLAHLFSVLLGVGSFYVVTGAADLRSPARERRPSAELYDVLRRERGSPSYKEGLALSNGATFSTAMLGLAVQDAERLAQVADIAAALTMEAACGRTRALDPKVHEVRNHEGQKTSAAAILALVQGSKCVDRADDVQDSYSLRCAPQVHGASRDAIAYARKVAEAEINAATDNPLFAPDERGLPCDVAFPQNATENLSKNLAYSAGNFHGQPIALAADFLTIALAEFADISERRTQVLLDGNHNRNLPENLVPCGGLSSGLMIAQYCAGGLVSENKVLAHPASVDSIPTCPNAEDHVSMATIASRKLQTVLANAQAVLAIELLVASQGVEWRIAMKRDPNESRPELKGNDLRVAMDREAAAFRQQLTPDAYPKVAEQLGRGTGATYLKLRESGPPLSGDRVLEHDIRAIRQMVEDGSLATSVLDETDTIAP